MKAGIFYTATGPIAILTSHASLIDPELIDRLHAKGIDSFMAWEVPMALAQERYGSHFGKVLGDVHEGDELRVLDDDGQRVFRRFRPSELGQPVVHDAHG